MSELTPAQKRLRREIVIGLVNANGLPHPGWTRIVESVEAHAVYLEQLIEAHGWGEEGTEEETSEGHEREVFEAMRAVIEYALYDVEKVINPAAEAMGQHAYTGLVGMLRSGLKLANTSRYAGGEA